MGKKGRGSLLGNLSDKRLELLGFISPGERPAHIAGSVTHIGTDTTCSPLFLVGQGLDDERHNCKQTTERDLWFYLKKKNTITKIKVVHKAEQLPE